MPRRILYAQYTNPGGYPPLEHSSRILAQAGWEVLFLGTDSFGGKSRRFPPHPNIQEERRKYCLPGWRQKVDYLLFCFWVLRRILSWRPRWVYFSSPLDALLAWLVCWMPGADVIYHEHDSPPDHWQGATSVIMWPRRWLFRRVFCIWPNLRRAELAAPECKRRAIVWNCPRREEAQPQREPAVPGELRVFYHGSVSPTRLPLAVIQAVALLPAGVRLTAVIYETIGSARHSQQLREEAERLGVADRVAVLKQRPRFESMQLCAEMDVGLTFMPLRTDDSNEEHASTASNKAFDYLACGVALLMSDRPDWRTTFAAESKALALDGADAGMGQVCNPEDPASIAAALRWFLEHPTEMRAMGERGRRRVLDDWNYEAQFQPVLDWMNKHG